MAISTIFAFGLQGFFALYIMHLFSPSEIGEFSVISQISAFWMVIALAQTPIILLANKSASLSQATVKSWSDSLYRAILLYPLIIIALYYSDLSLWPAILWASLITFFQMTWILTQSYMLVSGSGLNQALVRTLPPFSALIFSALGVYFRSKFDLQVSIIIVSAIIGYAIGAIWFFGVLANQINEDVNYLDINSKTENADKRSVTIRILHSLTDALLITLIATTWHRLYGAIETGLMMAILRVLSFMPLLVWSAWTQILIGRPIKNPNVKLFNFNISPWLVGAAASAFLLIICIVAEIAVNKQFLNPNWDGILDYITPLSIWQGASCFSTAFSHRPFQTQRTTLFSWLCIACNVIQMCVLILPFAFDFSFDKVDHIYIFCSTASLAAISMTVWLSRLR